MKWNPIQSAEFIEMLNSSIEQLSEAEKHKLLRIMTPLMRLPCSRISGQQGDELIVIGIVKYQILIYDDVEDEFGIVRYDSGRLDPIHEWDLYGGLKFALMQLKFR